MKKALLSAAMLLSVATSAIATTSEDVAAAMTDCSNQAKDKGLTGSDRRNFMAACLRDFHEAHPSFVPPLNQGTSVAHNPISGIILDADLGSVAITMGAMQSTTEGYSKSRSDLSAATEKLDADVAGAVKSAKGKPDLVKAIKEFYAAASAYLANGIPTGRLEQIAADRLKTDMNAKEKALNLEIKLSGM